MFTAFRRMRRATLEIISTPSKWAYALRSNSEPNFPEFLGIGAQKAGTTWLWNNLRVHPELWLPQKKELHYFDRNYRLSLHTYFEAFREGKGRVRGEITPAYGLIHSNRVRLIRRLRPDLRLILLLRNPIERAWSHAVMDLATYRNRPATSVSDREFYAHFRSSASRRRGDYLAILDKWSVFPSEQLFVGWYGDISAKPEVLLRAIFKHLGVSADISTTEFPLRETFHGGPRLSMPGHFRDYLESIYTGQIEQLESMTGHSFVDD